MGLGNLICKTTSTIILALCRTSLTCSFSLSSKNITGLGLTERATEQYSDLSALHLLPTTVQKYRLVHYYTKKRKTNPSVVPTMDFTSSPNESQSHEITALRAQIMGMFNIVAIITSAKRNPSNPIQSINSFLTFSISRKTDGKPPQQTPPSSSGTPAKTAPRPSCPKSV